jgi:hypothetical protein
MADVTDAMLEAGLDAFAGFDPKDPLEPLLRNAYLAMASAGARNEKTSPEIAHHAGRIVNMDDAQMMTMATQNPELIRRVAASALAQTEDKEPGPDERAD